VGGMIKKKKEEGWIGEAGREEDRVGMHADAE
jgi:hypothetical protein